MCTCHTLAKMIVRAKRQRQHKLSDPLAQLRRYAKRKLDFDTLYKVLQHYDGPEAPVRQWLYAHHPTYLYLYHEVYAILDSRTGSYQYNRYQYWVERGRPPLAPNVTCEAGWVLVNGRRVSECRD